MAAPAAASTIAAYNTVNGASIASGIEGACVTASNLTRGAGLREIGNANNFRSRNWSRSSSATAALASNDYYEWGFSSTSVYDLDSLDISYRNNDNGPKSIAVFASFDGGAFSKIFTDTTVTTSVEIANIDLTGQSVTNAEFRLVGYDAVTNAGRFWLRTDRVGEGNDYGISISGDVSVIPLPASLPLMALGLGEMVFVRRRA